MGMTWRIKDCYTGMGITWLRASTLMPTYFVLIDYFRRNHDNLFRFNIIGPFLGKNISKIKNLKI